jgi:hypothetical protein
MRRLQLNLATRRRRILQTDLQTDRRRQLMNLRWTELR